MTKPRASLVHFSFFWSVSGQEVDPENFALLTPPNFINQLLCSYAFKKLTRTGFWVWSGGVGRAGFALAFYTCLPSIDK